MALHMTVPRIRAICWTLVALGVVISFAVLWRDAVLTGLWPGANTRLFLTLFGGGYGAALASPAVAYDGLPLAAWSLIYYAALAGFLLLGQLFEEEFEEAGVPAFVVSLPALVISVSLAVMMLTGRTPFCRLCALAHLTNVALPFVLLRLTGRSATQVIRALEAGARYVITGKAEEPTEARWKLLGIVTVTLGAFAVYQWSLIALSPGSSHDPQPIVAKFETTEKQDLQVGPDDPVLGSAGAPVQLVIFTDFQCPTCRRYAAELHTMVDQYGDRLQVVLKHYPLNMACNPGLKLVDVHSRACEAAYAAEAARKQGKFWPFHDKLFATNLRDETIGMDALARDSGLDPERFKTDVEDISTQLKVHTDIGLAGKLQLTGTPTLFLNGRRLSSIRPQDVRVLIYHLLQEAAQPAPPPTEAPAPETAAPETADALRN